LEKVHVAGHSHFRLPAEEPADFGQRTAGISRIALIVAAVGLVLTLVLGFRDYLRVFYFAYLTGFGFFLAITLASQFFVLVQHATRAGWSVNVRRVAENLGAIAPIMGILSLPIVISVLLGEGDLYRWALPEHSGGAQHAAAHGSGAHDSGAHGPNVAHDAAAPGGAPKGEPSPSAAPAGKAEGRNAGNQEVAHEAEGGKGEPDESFAHEPDPGRGNRHLDNIIMEKRAYLNRPFFIARIIGYFLIWTLIARFFRGHSVAQDVDGDYRHTAAMQKWSGIALVGLGLTLTFAAFDLFMTLDPHWYSTMFGVYYFAGAAVSMFAAMILLIRLMQKAGYLREAVTPEHYHDLGKFMFAFTFFWGYVTFSQYMLLWYASIPEEVTWMSRHGATTRNNVPPEHLSWGPWALLVLFGCFVIPFAGLLSRHAKRNIKAVTFWACWVLVFQFVNMCWIVLPELRVGFKVMPLIAAVCAWAGIGGIFVFAWLRNTAAARIRPVNDPRVFESAAFVNV
jgi:hypothetical protein